MSVVCHWLNKRISNPELHWYMTECGHQQKIMMGTLEETMREYDWKYCVFCGGMIKVQNEMHS